MLFLFWYETFFMIEEADLEQKSMRGVEVSKYSLKILLDTKAVLDQVLNLSFI